MHEINSEKKLEGAPRILLAIRRADSRTMNAPIDLHFSWRPITNRHVHGPFAHVLYGGRTAEDTVRISKVPTMVEYRGFGPGQWTIRAESVDHRFKGFAALAVYGSSGAVPVKIVLTETSDLPVGGVVLDADSGEPVPRALVQPVVQTNNGFLGRHGYPPVETDERAFSVEP